MLTGCGAQEKGPHEAALFRRYQHADGYGPGGLKPLLLHVSLMTSLACRLSGPVKRQLPTPVTASTPVRVMAKDAVPVEPVVADGGMIATFPLATLHVAAMD